jgi:hypothetical protein
MNDDLLFRRIAAITAIVSAPVALGASFVLLNAIDFDSEIIENNVNILTLDPPIADTYRGVEFAGTFGYGLLLVPVTVYLWYWLKSRSPGLITLYTAFGLGGLFVGMIAGALYFSVFPPLMSAYPQASEAEREVMKMIADTQYDAATVGILNLMNLLSGIWLIGIGSVLRAERLLLGTSALIIGIGVFAFGVSNSLQISALDALELFTFLLPLWILWLGIVILRNNGPVALSESN